ncbi:MAG: hypothetical protein ACR2HR_06475 [Euzebya sp.]
MTFSKAWTYIRWPIAILGLFAVVQYALPRLGEAASGMIEFDGSGSIFDAGEASASESSTALDIPIADLPPETLEPGTGPVADGTATPIADYFVNDTVATASTEVLTLTDDPADSVVIAFDIPAGDPGCMAVMNLNLTATDVLSSVEVGIYASTVDDPLSVTDNLQQDGDLRATTEPMATALIEGAGTVTFNITGGFQNYFIQDFPPGRPLVLTVAPTAEVESQGGLSLVASESLTEEVPTLLWTGTPGCPVDDGPSPTPSQ